MPRSAAVCLVQPSARNHSSPAAMRTLIMMAVGFVLSTRPLHGESPGQYRDFRLGSDVSSVSALANRAASDVKTLHQRPAVMQELEWRPRGASAAAGPQADPVRQIVFSFFSNQLFKMVVDYDHDRTAGMTDADMIEGLTAMYGTALKPALRKASAATPLVDEETGTPIARWGDGGSSVMLYGSADIYQAVGASHYRVIVISPRLDALARAAAAQAFQLDERESVQRGRVQQKKEADDARTAQEKARLANKAAFRP